MHAHAWAFRLATVREGKAIEFRTVNATPRAAVSSSMKEMWERGKSVNGGDGGAQLSKKDMRMSPCKGRRKRVREKMKMTKQKDRGRRYSGQTD